MVNTSAPRKPRRGTHSCAECRRRKLRCSWQTDDAQTCRRCEERGIQCSPQTASSRSTTQNTVTTRDRVRRLEQHVRGLTSALRQLESRVGGEASNDISGSPAYHEALSESECSETESHMSDSGISTRPSYLKDLFNNCLLSSGDAGTGGPSTPGPKKLPSHLADAARQLLQPLIPSKGDVSLIASRASAWLPLLHTIFPARFMTASGEELLSQYDEVNRPDANPVVLASWLLAIGVTAEHIPQNQQKTPFSQAWMKDLPTYSRAVSNAVENAIVNCDGLVTSREGVETTMLLFRLHLMRGNFSKSFFVLRRALAAAELIGLQRASDGPRAVLWAFLCSIERFHSMLLGFPSATRYYHRLKSVPLFANGRAIPGNFLSQLSEVALKLGDLGAIQASASPSNELHDTISTLDNDLRRMASLAPPEWWTGGRNLPLLEQIMQYLFNYVTMRAHLPLVLRSEMSMQFTRSRLACIEASFSLIRAYLELFPMLPDELFINRLTELQLFPAVVILLLTGHTTYTSGTSSLLEGHSEKSAENLIVKILEALQNSLVRGRSSLTKQAINTIKALARLLENDNADHEEEGLVLTVPLLGKLHVRRRQRSDRNSAVQNRLYKAPSHEIHQPHVESSRNYEDFPVMENETLGPLSWFIEDTHDTPFYDAFMMDDYNPQNYEEFNESFNVD